MSTSLASEAVGFQDQLEELLGGFLEQRCAEHREVDPRIARAVDALSRLVLSGGKRLRPWYVEWAFRSAGGEVDERLVRAAAAVELLHTFALIQDDIIDGSAMRRGRDAMHVALAQGESGHYGISAALLLADLAFVWSDELLLDSGFDWPRLRPAIQVFNRLREEVAIGELLDLSLTADRGNFTPELTLQLNLRKTAGYSVQRPIELGFALAGAPPALASHAASYAQPAGVAFQLRDDLLSAFGDSRLTGKPDGDDLLYAKPTWLLARGLGKSTPEGAELRRLVALPYRDHEDVAAMREALTASGAVDDAEAMIARLHGQAVRAARDLPVGHAHRAELIAVTARLVDRAA